MADRSFDSSTWVLRCVHDELSNVHTFCVRVYFRHRKRARKDDTRPGTLQCREWVMCRAIRRRQRRGVDLGRAGQDLAPPSLSLGGSQRWWSSFCSSRSSRCSGLVSALACSFEGDWPAAVRRPRCRFTRRRPASPTAARRSPTAAARLRRTRLRDDGGARPAPKGDLLIQTASVATSTPTSRRCLRSFE